jgi:hypothetical protein
MTEKRKRREEKEDNETSKSRNRFRMGEQSYLKESEIGRTKDATPNAEIQPGLKLKSYLCLRHQLFG